MITTEYDADAKMLKVVYDGKVTAKDYEESLVPAIKKELKRDHTIRLVIDLSKLDRFTLGAMFQDSKLGFDYMKKFEKVSIITGPGIIDDMKHLFEKMMPNKVKFFKPNQTQEAHNWAA